jgi:hypothetical protein
MAGQINSSDCFGALVLANVVKRPASVQAVRFEFQVNFQNLSSLLGMLSGHQAIRFHQWSNNKIYIELKKKATPSMFSGFPALQIGGPVLQSSILGKDVLGCDGDPITTRNKPGVLSSQISQKRTLPSSISNGASSSSGGSNKEAVKKYYEYIKKHGEPPCMKGNLDYMLYTQNYERVATFAYAELSKENFSMVFKKWHKLCLRLVLQQNEREVLWVWDHTGNTGKTYVSFFLR